MRHNPDTVLSDDDVVKGVIRRNPWATMISHGDDGLVASHYPFLLDETAENAPPTRTSPTLTALSPENTRFLHTGGWEPKAAKPYTDAHELCIECDP